MHLYCISWQPLVPAVIAGAEVRLYALGYLACTTTARCLVLWCPTLSCPPLSDSVVLCGLHAPVWRSHTCKVTHVCVLRMHGAQAVLLLVCLAATAFMPTQYQDALLLDGRSVLPDTRVMCGVMLLSGTCHSLVVHMNAPQQATGTASMPTMQPHP